MHDGDAETQLAAEQRPQETDGTEGVEAHAHRLGALHALGEGAVGLEQRLHLAAEERDVRSPHVAPQLLVVHHQERRRAKVGVAADGPQRLERPRVDAGSIDHHDVRPQIVRELEPRAGPICHRDHRACRAELLCEEIGARRVGLDHQEAYAAEGRERSVLRLAQIEGREARRRRLVELVGHALLAAGHHGLEARHQILDGLGERAIGPQHHLRAAGLARDREHPRAQRLSKERHHVVEARRLERACRFAGTLRELARQLGDAARHLVRARGAIDHRDEPMPEPLEPPRRGAGIGDQDHRHRGRGGLPSELPQHLFPRRQRRLPCEHDHVGRHHERGGHHVLWARQLHLHPMLAQPLDQRRRETLPGRHQENGGLGSVRGGVGHRVRTPAGPTSVVRTPRSPQRKRQQDQPRDQSRTCSRLARASTLRRARAAIRAVAVLAARSSDSAGSARVAEPPRTQGKIVSLLDGKTERISIQRRAPPSARTCEARAGKLRTARPRSRSRPCARRRCRWCRRTRSPRPPGRPGRCRPRPPRPPDLRRGEAWRRAAWSHRGW